MKLTWPRFFLAFFIAAVVIAIPVALHAEDGQAESQVARQIRAPQTLFAASQTSSTLTAEQIAPAIPECEIAHNCPSAAQPPRAVIVATPPAGTDFTATVSSVAQIIIAVVGALLSWPLAKFFGTQTSATQILNDAGMTKYATYAAELCVRWGLQATGATAADLKNVEFRNQFIGYAAKFLNAQFPEVVSWVTTSGTLSQFIGAHLPHDAALPPGTLAGAPIPAAT